MRIPKATGHRRVNILSRIRVFVVMAVICRPPENTPLSTTLSQARQYKLKNPTRLEGSMGKIAMEACGDPKHPNQIKNHTTNHRLPSNTTPYQTKGGEMNQDERPGRDPIDAACRRDARHILFSLLTLMAPIEVAPQVGKCQSWACHKMSLLCKRFREMRYSHGIQRCY